MSQLRVHTCGPAVSSGIREAARAWGREERGQGLSVEGFVESLEGQRGALYQVKIYWAWLFLRLTSAGRPIGAPLDSISMV